MLRRSFVLSVVSAIAVGMVPTVAHAATPPATVGATNVFPAVPGTTAPVGNVTVTESAAGQLTVGDVVTVQLRDAANAATAHLTTTPVVSGTNGLAATLAVASSNTVGTPLQDQVKVTITAPSTGAFPGVLTVAQLNPVLDVTAAIGAVNATVSDVAGLVTTSTVQVGTLVTGGTLKATFAAVSQPVLLSSASNQAAGSITIAEPAKAFFKTGDVITFRVRDVNGSADTIGLAATPLASGGAMSVSVQGLNGPTVQPNETGFAVVIDAQDPSNGSTSTLTVSNIVLNTALAPSGPITLSAMVTTGATSEYIVPGRVTIATVGGNTSTTSAGDPILTVPGTGQAAANVTISAAAGSLRAGDTFSLAIQEAGVTFAPSTPPMTSLTAGNLALAASAGTLDPTNTTATWTVQNPNTAPSTIVIGPIYYDVAAGAIPGRTVTVKTSGGGSFTSQTVTNALLTTGDAGLFKPLATPATTVPGSPAVVPGVDVRYTEPAAGALPAANSALVLLSPYANQIAAYRTTFAAIPSATVTGTLVLGAPIVNSSTIAVTTGTGVISAPAQTAVIFPVTTASTGTPAQVTFSNLSYLLGNYVPPGVLVGLGTANTGTGAVTSTSGAVAGTVLNGNAYADAINGKGLGSASAGDTTAPETYLDGGPANGSTVFNSSSVTFYFHSSEDPFAKFTCTLISQTTAGDSSTIFENNCGQASGSTPPTYSKTYPSLADGHYTFYVQATDAANNTDATPATTTFDLGFDKTAPTVLVSPGTTVASPIKLTFSEPVKGLSKTTVTMTPSTSITLACKNGTATVDCLTGPVTSATIVPSPAMIPGQTYTVTVNPAGAAAPITDVAGNALTTTSKTFRAALTEQETGIAARYAWRPVATASASGGSYAASHRPGSSATFKFSGTSITWYTVTGPSFGKATVYVDGVAKLSANNYASATKYGVARTITGLSSASHTLKIVVAGVKGSTAATDSLVAIDRFVVGAASTQQSSAAVSYAWSLLAGSGASGGRYSADDLAGASVSFTFKGTSVSWYTVTAPLMGKANVYIDGVKKATVDNYSSSTLYNIRRTYGGLTNAVHTIKIVLTGTHRTGATGNRVAVPRFGFPYRPGCPPVAGRPLGGARRPAA